MVFRCRLGLLLLKKGGGFGILSDAGLVIERLGIGIPDLGFFERKVGTKGGGVDQLGFTLLVDEPGSHRGCFGLKLKTLILF